MKNVFNCFCAFLFAILFATASFADVPANSPAAPTEHLWNLQNVDIKSVVAEISRETGKNFILDPSVSGKITIISSHPMGPEESYQVFLSSLRLLGFAVVPEGDDLKIVPTRDAANQAMLASNGSPGFGDQAVVRVIPMHYVSALQIIPALRPLLPTWGNLTAYPPSNAIVISGSADNVQRIADIVAEVDTPSANGIDIVHLNNAVATDLVTELNQLILAARANGAAMNVTLSADQQSNSILISGDAVSRLNLKVLAAKIDAEDALSGNSNTQVIYLHYIQVKDILPILKGMVHQSVSYSLSSGTASAASSSSSSNGSSLGSLGQLSSQYSAAASTQIDNATLNGGTSDPKATVTIVGDVTNNALVLTAPPTTMIQLKNVIDDLDVAPQQILVEAIVAQVDAGTAQQLGIQWGSASPAAAALTSPYAFAGGGMGVGFIEAADFTTLIEALSSDTNSNILSTPSITVLNNAPANIQVGENIFQSTGTYNPTVAGGGVVTQYQQQQVGLNLNVIPQVTDGNSVRLIIDQTNSAVIPGSKDANGNVNTTAEQISTQVMVNSGQILVLGGLLQGTDQETVDKVPFLGDIPVLGYLFRSYDTTVVKKDLMIFLRPVVLTPQQQDNITLERYDFMRDVAILNSNNQGNLIGTSTLPSRANPDIPMPFDDSDQ